MNTDIIQPHSDEAEEAVLGSVMIDGEMWARVEPMLQPRMFWRRRHAQIYQAMLNAHGKGRAIDQVIVAHEIDRLNLWEATGGGAYLSHLVSIIPTPLHAPYYAQIVKDCWERREKLRRGARMVEEAATGRT